VLTRGKVDGEPEWRDAPQVKKKKKKRLGLRTTHKTKPNQDKKKKIPAARISKLTY